MNVAIVGTGYVGLVTGACLAEAGNTVVCIDDNAAKLARIQQGVAPFHEPGLMPLVAQMQSQARLRFTSDLGEGTKSARLILLAVGTPSAADGCADTSGLLNCVAALAGQLDHACIVAIKSTAPVGTCEQAQAVFDARPEHLRLRAPIEVASNPEFLAEGHALEDFRHPERIVIGAGTPQAAHVLQEAYAPFDHDGAKLMLMGLRSAEFAKYACNAMLAARISVVNELACIAGRLGADVQAMCKVAASDSRIGGRYLQPGAGYGGSCLPKDLRALIRMADSRDEPATLLRSVERVNQRQIRLLFEAIRAHFQDRLDDRCIAVWGLAFKPGTDDIREAPSLALIRLLLDAGARIRAYDPVAAAAVRRAVDNPRLVLAPTALDACRHSDALAVLTEWPEFTEFDLHELALCLKASAVFDGRHLYRTETLSKAGLLHYPIGRDAGREAGFRMRRQPAALHGLQGE